MVAVSRFSVALISLLGIATVFSGAPYAQVASSERDGQLTEADLLVRKMIAASGGMERWNSIRDVTFTLRNIFYDVGDKPLVSDQEMSVTKDPRSMVRADVRHGGNIHSKIYDGANGWAALDGILLDKGKATSERVRDVCKSLLFWFEFPFNLVHPSVRLEYLGAVHQMGAHVDVLQVTFRDTSLAVHADDVYRFYVNRLTHLVTKEEYYPNGGDRVLEYLWGDYRLVNGLMRDHVRDIVSIENRHRYQRLEVRDLRLGVEVPRHRFRRPPDPDELNTPQE